MVVADLRVAGKRQGILQMGIGHSDNTNWAFDPSKADWLAGIVCVCLKLFDDSALTFQSIKSTCWLVKSLQMSGSLSKL